MSDSWEIVFVDDDGAKVSCASSGSWSTDHIVKGERLAGVVNGIEIARTVH